jgi:hypothetical protein
VKDRFPPGFDVSPVGEPIIEARKGFAAPPVIWGRRPCPSVEPLPVKPPAPKGIELERIADGPVAGENWPPPKGEVVPLAVSAGVAGKDPGIEGKDSSSAVPNDDDGLNGFKPANPVIWGLRELELEDVEVVAPVNWLGKDDEKKESEGIDPVPVTVFCALRAPDGKMDVGLVCWTAVSFPFALLNVNDEATLDISVAPALSAPELKLNPPLACCCIEGC